MSEGNKSTQWKFIRTLGQGSFGVVELWKNQKSGGLNALKRFEIRGGTGMSDKMIEEFRTLWRKEVELMSNKLGECQYIVSSSPTPSDLISALSSRSLLDQHQPLLFMEYCSGGTLRQQLKLPENICGLQESEVLTVLDHLSKAILFLHKNEIVHRDLKPDNVLRFVDGNNKIIYKLSDLGLAKDVSKGQCNTFVGTPQYLAPEIFVGKTYDKTVDYWSFGIIAFEIICGLRPFLHGESAGNWLPLVEEKAKDVVCIYRNGDGQIVGSNTIPFFNHLTDVLKDCLVTWLRTMLQFDPSLRGHKISNTEEPSVNLKLLSATLSTNFLEIEAIKERLAFPVGLAGQTKIGEIKQRIFLRTGLMQDNQLLLTRDGTEVVDGDPASKYLGAQIYLIPLVPDLIRLKVRFPKSVNAFILQWDGVKDASKLRKIWACAIFYLQAELRKIEIVKKSVECLKAWCSSKIIKKVKDLQLEIEKGGAGFGVLLELEERLEGIDRKYDVVNDSEELGRKYWKTEMSKTQVQYRACFDQWVENVVLRPVFTRELEELYYKLLKACSEWKSSDSRAPPFSYNETLVRSVCQFIVLVTEIDDSLMYNIRSQLDKVKSDMKLVEQLNSVLTSINQLTQSVLEQRCTKQTKLVQAISGSDDLPLVLGNENVPPNNPNNEDKLVRGGGYPPSYYEQKKMSKSTILPSTLEKTGRLRMALSMDGRNERFVARLLEESQILRKETEDRLTTLRNSTEEINQIRKEKESISWDFLKGSV